MLEEREKEGKKKREEEGRERAGSRGREREDGGFGKGEKWMCLRKQIFDLAKETQTL